jgi:hypothetical protein
MLRGAGFPARNVDRLASRDLGRAVAALFEAEQSVGRARADALDALRAAISAQPQPVPAAYRRAWRHVVNGRRAEAPAPELREVLAAVEHSKDAVATARADLARIFTAASEHANNVVREIAAEPRFREAVTWQNRTALRTGIDAVLGPSGGRVDPRHGELVARYYTRYCTKNDTIGFFGPVGWATLSDAAQSVTVRPGPRLVGRRETHLEQWAIDALVETIAKDGALEPWIAPRRLPFVTIAGAHVRSPLGGGGRLPAERVALLRASDGSTPAREVAAALIRDRLFASEHDVFAALHELRDHGLIAWQLELPLGWEPESELSAQLARIADPAVRTRAAQPLAELGRARARVAAAAGDAVQLDAALAALEGTFTSLTGRPATCSPGAMYAARTLVFEDTVRDIDVAIGRDVLAELAGPLALVLTSLRWLTLEIARRYAVAFSELHAALAAGTGSRKVSLVDFWFRATRLLFGTERPVDAAAADFHERWSRVLRIDDGAHRTSYTSAQLDGVVHELFAAPGPGWPEARYHSPDIMIAARGVDAIRRGDYTLVLGEVHVAMCTIDAACVVAKHPTPDELHRAAALDVPESRVLPALPKDTSRANVRTSRGIVNPKDLHVEVGPFLAKAPRDRVVALAELVVVERGDRLVVTNASGSIAIDVVDFFGDTLSVVAADAASALGQARTAAHRPRIAIDRLVIQRETWSVAAAELVVAGPRDQQYIAIRRWAHEHGLPRRVFVKSPLETKPTFVDLDSPISVHLLAKTARRASEAGEHQRTLVFTEMLPDLDELWLPDADGELYTAELRVVAVDGEPPRGGSS